MILPNIEETACAGIALTTMALFNAGARVPVFSRLPLYGVMGIGGYFVGSVLHQYKLKRILTREVYLWDYIKQHPEDFPELEKKKYKDVMQTWHPIRG